jgi:hypothetical protein
LADEYEAAKLRWVGGGGRTAPRLAWQCAQKDGCAQRTGAHARPKPTSYIIIEQLAQPCEGVWGARSPPFTIFTITYKVVVYAPAERAAILPLFLLYPYMYSVLQAPPPPSYLGIKLGIDPDHCTLRRTLLYTTPLIFIPVYRR